MKMRITYREVFIVLVIIGLCFLIGRNVISMHKLSLMRKEVASVEKIAASLNAYHARLGKFPTDAPYKIAADMIQGGYLLREDFYSSLGRGYWNFIGCVNDWDENYFNIHYSIGENSGVCLYLAPDMPDIEKNYTNNITSSRLACYLESVVDDINVKTGKGRGGMNFISQRGDALPICNKEPFDDFNWYLFRIF